MGPAAHSCATPSTSRQSRDTCAQGLHARRDRFTPCRRLGQAARKGAMAAGTAGYCFTVSLLILANLTTQFFLPKLFNVLLFFHRVGILFKSLVSISLSVFNYFLGMQFFVRRIIGGLIVLVLAYITLE